MDTVAIYVINLIAMRLVIQLYENFVCFLLHCLLYLFLVFNAANHSE